MLTVVAVFMTQGGNTMKAIRGRPAKEYVQICTSSCAPRCKT